METKKIIFGGLAGGIVFFLLGFVFYGLLLKEYFASQTPIAGSYKEMPNFLPLILGNISMGFVFALILGRWTSPASAGDGAKTAMLAGVFIVMGYDLVTFGVSNITTLQGTITDIAITTVMCGIVGAVETLVMGTSRKTVTV